MNKETLSEKKKPFLRSPELCQKGFMYYRADMIDELEREAIKELMEWKNIEHDGSFMSVGTVNQRIKEIFGEELTK